MATPTTAQRREDRERAARVAEELVLLNRLSVPQLRARLTELTGHEARSRNRIYLRKRVAWHLQAAEYGGLSEAALAKIEELIPKALEYYEARARRLLRPPANDGPFRDPRLPAVGTVLHRAFGGVEHEVTVLEKGVEYRGKIYRSLSGVAREISGSTWNGYAFFGCRAPSDGPGEEGAS